MQKFLEATKYVDYHEEVIQQMVRKLFSDGMSDLEKTRAAYEFVRDEIPHSFDCNATIIVAKASDVLRYQNGICDAKANLLAALLRSQNIPTGFCYEHITLVADDSLGYCVHAYNAAYLDGRWIKLDARGNKEGINSQFSMGEPMLSYPPRAEYDEYFFRWIYANPHQKTMDMLEAADSIQYIMDHIPEYVAEPPDIDEASEPFL